MKRKPTPGLSHSRARLGVLTAFVFALLFIAAFTWAGPSRASGSALGEFGWQLFSETCHQRPERSLAPFGTPLAVCARCSGLYVGGALGMLTFALFCIGRRRLDVRWLLLFLAPTAIDAILPWFGLPQLTKFPRFLISIPAGWMAAQFLSWGVQDLFKPRYAALTPPLGGEEETHAE